MVNSNSCNFKKILLTGIGLSLFIFTGCCKECENHIKKPIDYPTTTRAGLKYEHIKADLNCHQWWMQLHDLQLNRLINNALITNNQLHSAAATVLAAQAQLKAAQAMWIPTLDASFTGYGGSIWNTDLVPMGNLASTNLFSNIHNLSFPGYYTGFVPGYTVNIFNNIYNIKAAKANLAKNEAQAQATKLALISQITGAYLMLLSQREQLQLEQKIVYDLAIMRQFEQGRNRNGANNVELLSNMGQQIALEKTRIPEIKSTIARTENTIHLLLNQNPGSFPTNRSIMTMPSKQIIPKNVPFSTLENRPDVLIAIANLKSACAQIGISYAAFFPTIGLSNLTGVVSAKVEQLLKLHANIWVLTGNATTKLLNLNAFQKLKASKAGFQATYYEYLQTLRSVFKDIDDTLTNEHNKQLSFDQQLIAYQAAQTNYNIAQSQYKHGAKDYRNVLEAQINLTKNKLYLLQSKAQLMDSIVQFYNAIGGSCDL